MRLYLKLNVSTRTAYTSSSVVREKLQLMSIALPVFVRVSEMLTSLKEILWGLKNSGVFTFKLKFGSS